jgi:predicted DNA-binding transcriptional regulator YafY
MSNEKEYTGRTRSLKILFAIVESPFFYTKERFSKIYGVSKDAISDDFDAFRAAGFDLAFDKHYRYALSAEKKYDNLRELLVFSKKEEDILTAALQKLGANDKAVEKLQKKLSRVYDVSKMNNVFDKNFLTKMDLLEKAIKDKKAVILKDYHSTNSSTVRNRTVEVFSVSAEDDIVHAFDLEAKGIRHFRISRISKLDITQTNWAYEGSHYIQSTDCFRIHNNKQVSVHLRLKVGAYNQLLEQYPTARNFIKPTSESEDMYDFQCKVNALFYGITNFIMGNYRDIEAIYEPESLIEHVEAEARKLLDKKF